MKYEKMETLQTVGVTQAIAFSLILLNTIKNIKSMLKTKCIRHFTRYAFIFAVTFRINPHKTLIF